MALTADQQSTLDQLTAWVDQGRRLFDLAATFGLGTIPGVDTAKAIFDGVDTLWDYADQMAKGTLSLVKAEVQSADEAAATAENLKFPNG